MKCTTLIIHLCLGLVSKLSLETEAAREKVSGCQLTPLWESATSLEKVEGGVLCLSWPELIAPDGILSCSPKTGLLESTAEHLCFLSLHQENSFLAYKYLSLQ